jgi:hypothetical protein
MPCHAYAPTALTAAPAPINSHQIALCGVFRAPDDAHRFIAMLVQLGWQSPRNLTLVNSVTAPPSRSVTTTLWVIWRGTHMPVD